MNYNYNMLSVSVTASGTALTPIQLATSSGGGDVWTRQICGQVISILARHARPAMGAHISAVAIASDHRAGFARSLRCALSNSKT